MTDIAGSSAAFRDTPILLAQQGDLGDLWRGNVLWLVLLVVVLIVGLAFFAIFARYFRLWIQSVTTGAGIGISRPVADDVSQGQSDRDYAQQDHGRAGRAV